MTCTTVIMPEFVIHLNYVSDAMLVIFLYKQLCVLGFYNAFISLSVILPHSLNGGQCSVVFSAASLKNLIHRVGEPI